MSRLASAARSLSSRCNASSKNLLRDNDMLLRIPLSTRHIHPPSSAKVGVEAAHIKLLEGESAAKHSRWRGAVSRRVLSRGSFFVTARWKVDEQKMALVVQVVLAAFVHNPHKIIIGGPYDQEMIR